MNNNVSQFESKLLRPEKYNKSSVASGVRNDEWSRFPWKWGHNDNKTNFEMLQLKKE
jgi:hypothetical protein